MKQKNIDLKMELRSFLFDWLPPSLYSKIVPLYFKMFNPKRRKCEYKFSINKSGNVILHSEKKKFYFADHKRIERYFYKNGLDKIQNLLNEKYLSDECRINKNDIVVEVGANVGEFTLSAAAIADRVYAFEPDPKCFECLRLNVQSLRNVEIYKYGISNVDEEKKFYLFTEDADSSFVEPEKYTKIIKIKAIRLDTWMMKKKIKKIGFLKVEAEGAELEVLIGLGEKINNVQNISVDGSPERKGKSTFNEVASYLLQKNFNVIVNRYQVYAWKNNVNINL